MRSKVPLVRIAFQELFFEYLNIRLILVGSGIFWLSLYNPSERSCVSIYECTSHLRTGYGHRISFHSFESDIHFNVSDGSRCVQVSMNDTSNQLDDMDCNVKLKVACESSCALDTKGIFTFFP